jgi:alpha-glucosidase
MILSFVQTFLLTLLSTVPLLPTRSFAQAVIATASSSSQFTVPSSAALGFPILPTIQDPEAPDAQASCPGYTASNVQSSSNGFSADLELAGQPCNVFGTDVQSLKLSVEYQSSQRLNVNIKPSILVGCYTMFLVPLNLDFISRLIENDYTYPILNAI